MDFGDRLAQKIKADVERRIEMSLSGATQEAVAGTGRLALVGLVPLVLLVAAIVAIVLLVKLVV